VNELHEPTIAARAGAPLESAQAAVVMVHGRGDSAPGILSLASALEAPGVAYVAPQARHNTWYPYSFMAPMERNEPWLTPALAAVHGAVEEVVAAGVPRERIVLLGFSQGACLASEYLARHAQRFGGLAALSGGLIGPEGTPRDYEGSLGGTPAFLGCSDVDPHIPVERVHETEEVLARLGAQVDKRIYPGFGHSVNQDEVDAVNAMLRGLVDG